MTRKAPGPKKNDRRRKTMLAKGRYKLRVLAQPIPTTPTPTTPVNSTAPIPTVATASTQMPIVKSAATSIPVMVYYLATGKFSEVPYPPARPQNKEYPSIHSSNPLPLEDIPNAPVRQGTSWPSTGPASENLFETRKDWHIRPTPAPTVKTESPPQVVAIPHAMVMPKQVAEKCTWGLHCPICKNEEKHREEDWDGGRQKEQPRNQYPQNTQHHQSQNTQQPQPQNTQHPQSFDVLDRYSEQIRVRREWEEKIECLNKKYNLDYYSSSELESNFELQHKYETLI